MPIIILIHQFPADLVHLQVIVQPRGQHLPAPVGERGAVHDGPLPGLVPRDFLRFRLTSRVGQLEYLLMEGEGSEVKSKDSMSLKPTAVRGISTRQW